MEVLPTSEELTQTGAFDWQRVRAQPRSVPSGRLNLRLESDHYRFPNRPRQWADRKRWRLEDRLTAVLEEIDHRAAADQQRAANEAAAAQRARAEQDAAAEAARTRWQRNQRVAALTQQLGAWDTAQRARSYSAALETAADAVDPNRQDRQLREWITWIRAHADRIDPLTEDPLPRPQIGEPTTEDLQPYLPRRPGRYG